MYSGEVPARSASRSTPDLVIARIASAWPWRAAANSGASSSTHLCAHLFDMAGGGDHLPRVGDGLMSGSAFAAISSSMTGAWPCAAAKWIGAAPARWTDRVGIRSRID